MPRHTRTSRLVARVAVGAVVGLPLLAAGPAAAATPRVEFAGSGAGLLSCRSTPSDADLTVPAESTVIFVNKLDDVATLRINGRNATRVSKDESTEVLFHRGTVRIEMVPDCGLTLASDIKAVSVTVAAPGAAAAPSSSGPAKPAGSSQAGVASSQSSRASHRAGGAGSASPGRSASIASSAPAAGGVASPPDAGAGEGPAGEGDEGVAAEPVSTTASSEEDGPNGLLAVIAIVCVVGVSAGAIRAIAAQRATGTSVA